MTAELTLTVDIEAPAELVWDVVTDWPGQGEWMLATRVRIDGPGGSPGDSPGDGRRLGATMSAVTGIGPLAVTDTMVITEWEPPTRCVVHHTGAVIRGDGIFEVTALGPERARFRWSELLELPFGVVGRAGWPIARPLLRLGVARSLHAMARHCEEKYRAHG